MPIMMGRGGSGGGSWVSIQSGAGSLGVSEQPIEVTVTDADVSGVRVVVRRSDRQ